MWSYAALFAAAFLSATLLPGLSEASLFALVRDGAGGTLTLWLVASVGNTLGSVVNWWFGRFCLRWRDRRWFPVSARQLDRGTRLFRRYGLWSLLFAWLPVVGDPLTFAAGVLRAPFVAFLILVAIGKAARYAVVLGIAVAAT